MQIDHRSDYLVWDDVESVTVVLKRNTANGGDVSIGCDYARRDDDVRSDVQFEGIGTDQASVEWSIPDAELNPLGTEGREIRRDDQIVDGDPITFRVVSAGRLVDNSKWVAITVQDRA